MQGRRGGGRESEKKEKRSSTNEELKREMAGNDSRSEGHGRSFTVKYQRWELQRLMEVYSTWEQKNTENMTQASEEEKIK